MLRSNALLARHLIRYTRFARSGVPQWRRWIRESTKEAEDGSASVKRRARPPKVKAEAEEPSDPDPVPKRKRGRPRKTEAATDTSRKDAADHTPAQLASTLPSPKRPRRTKHKPPSSLPPRLTAPTSPHHHNLSTFLSHATQANLNPNSAVYKGTHYEYTCMATLADKTLNFELYRTGRANDLGVDLVGWWKVPDDRQGPSGEEEEERVGKGKGKGRKRKKAFRKLKVLAQCKATSTPPKPAQIRELEGAYTGAPSGWNSTSSVLALLLTTQPATKGVLAAVQRSRWPMGVLQVTREGVVRQFVWNAVARESGLESLGVVGRYGRAKGDEAGEGRVGVRLTWRGRLWRG